MGVYRFKSQVPTWSLSDPDKSTCVCYVCLYHFNKPISLLWPRVELVGEAYQFIQCKITKVMVVAYLGVESSTPSLHPHIIGGIGVPAMLSSSQIRYPLDSSRETLRYLGAQVNSVILCVLLLYHCVLFYCIIVCALIVVKFTF